VAAEWNFAIGKGASLLTRLSEMPTKLGDIAHTFVGTQTSAEKVFVLEDCYTSGSFVHGYSRSLLKRVKVEADCVVPFLHGKDIRRYQALASKSYLICPYEISKGDCVLLTEEDMGNRFTLAYEYFQANREVLARREKGRFRGEGWYRFGYPKSMTMFHRTKLVVPDYNDEASFSFDNQGYFFKTGYGAIATEPTASPYFILGLLNSKLLFTYLRSISTSLRGGYVRFWSQYIEQLPIRTIDSNDVADKKRHDSIVTKVEAMLEAKKQLAKAHIDKKKTYYENRCTALDRQIDRLVYDLYDLTDDEIEIVEGTSIV